MKILETHGISSLIQFNSSNELKCYLDHNRTNRVVTQLPLLKLPGFHTQETLYVIFHYPSIIAKSEAEISQKAAIIDLNQHRERRINEREKLDKETLKLARKGLITHGFTASQLHRKLSP